MSNKRVTKKQQVTK